MLFRRIILNALFVGLLAGLLLTAAQTIGVTPIIFAAEVYETADEAPVADHDHQAMTDHDHESSVDSHEHGINENHEHGLDDSLELGLVENHEHGTSENHNHQQAATEGHSHEHDSEAWAPEDGAERTLYTLVSNILASIGFSALLLSLMAQAQAMGITNINISRGAAWGIAGFIVCFAAPGIGLPPEIPGIEAAPLEYRQEWWLLAVVASATGLAVLAFSPIKYKALGLLAIAVPYVIGAPQHQGPEFGHPDANAVAALSSLHHDFIIASSVANLIFWVAMGILSAWVLKRWVLNSSSQALASGA
ncbi:hypothetical protein BTA51_14300 [Hahella sp. CCB-MM4]|uniref:CbtA family protein n=1 Tax=Hahella sp. (strain CCB-MM4) TaxID=1926491 RepID=UPI000B9AF90A|nr:CbtA family protein [Hahella sp. CCB-MM4]OZG72696.1 hypothetical protein BTA51_14300 [Hahella sp. CCB-MM4]